MRLCRPLVIALIAVALAGCAGRAGYRSVVAAPPRGGLDSLAYGAYGSVPPASVARVGGPMVAVAPPPAATEQPYTLDSGDKLRIVVYGQEGLTNSYLVDAGGNVTIPLINSVRARGLTTNQLSQAIVAKLRRGYVREPHVAVEVETYRPFFILGEVNTPGQYPYVPDMTVETAVAVAGGFTPRANRNRIDLSRPVDGQAIRATVPPTTLVRPGDTIRVSERWF